METILLVNFDGRKWRKRTNFKNIPTPIIDNPQPDEDS